MENNYSKILKSNKKILVAGIIILMISISFFVISSNLEEKEKEELVVKDYNELISLEQDVENEYVELTITDLPYGFAEETEDGNVRNYYFVYDQYDYMYIVRLTDSTYERLENIYKLNPEAFSYTLRGYIFEDEEELKQLAISVYNEAMEEEVVNEDNFRLYFGNTYLDENKTPFTIVDILLIVGMCGILVAVIVLIIYFVGAIKIKKVVKKIRDRRIRI